MEEFLANSDRLIGQLLSSTAVSSIEVFLPNWSRFSPLRTECIPALWHPVVLPTLNQNYFCPINTPLFPINHFSNFNLIYPLCYVNQIYIYIYIYIYIQDVSRLVDITAGDDFLGLCDQKSSYKYASDFGRLRSYGHFYFPYTPSCEPRLTEPAGG